MKRILSILLGLFAFFTVDAQTNLTFTQISTATTDLIYTPGYKSYDWNFQQDRIDLPTEGVPSNSPDLYYRFTWVSFTGCSGAENQYNWAFFDQQVNQAINTRRKFAFSIMHECGGCDKIATFKCSPSGGPPASTPPGLSYPPWLHNKMQAEPIKDWIGDFSGDYVPYYNGNTWLTAWENLNIAINNHIMTTSFNGVPYSKVISYIDARGYADFGEWAVFEHGLPAGSASTAQTDMTAATAKRILDATYNAYPNFKILNLLGTFAGNVPNTTASMPISIAPEVGAYALQARGGHTGIRFDSWGIEQSNLKAIYFGFPSWFNNGTIYNGYRFDTAIANRWKYGIIGGEPVSDVVTYSELLSADAGVAAWHVNGIGNGNYNPCCGVTASTTVRNNVRAASRASGPKLVLTGGTMTTTLTPGQPFNITLNWQNLGVCPLYEDWTVQYELRTTGGAVVWTGTSTKVLNLFHNGGAITPQSDNFTLPAVANGTYNMFIIIRDPIGYRTTPLPLYITGVQPDGSYAIRAGITVAASGSVVAFAGNNATITLPTNSYLLDGSGSTGTITSYNWTFLSGPSTPTLVSPSNVTCPANNLNSVGTYIFRLSVNGGVSTSQVNITVNPAPPPVANAGSNQTVVLPTSSCTLTGSGSTGTITSYAWTKISGPSGGNISTPTTANTTVTGLIQGTYVFQLSLNGGVSTAQTTVTVVPAGTGTGVFTTQTPAAVLFNDGLAIELGMKFQSLVGGFVTGVRFYKVVGNSGTHVGELYNSSGTRLAQVNFSGETASGWQSATFSSPVSITANTTYIIAYFSPTGNYTATNGYFATSTVNNPLTGLASGFDGPNGVYNYTGTPSFPNTAGNQANYWVDVTFATTPAPVANAGNNQTITLPTSSVTVDGSGSTGTITSYLWSKISGPAGGTITSPTTVSTTITALGVGTYVFQLSVNGGVSTSNVTITVNPAPAVANAGNNIAITLPTSSATLDGSASTGTITSYSWTQISGPNTAGISSPSTVTTGITGLIQGTYVFQLSVNSGQSSDQVSVLVNPAPATVANAGPDQTISVPSSSVTLNGTASTGTISSILWTRVSGPNTPTIGTPTTLTTGVTGLIQGTYVFNLNLNSGASTDNVTITVNPTPTNVHVFTSQIPAEGTANDGVPIELGMKFRSTAVGYITQLRFYKTSGNTGTHIGELYTGTGTLLSQITFTGETATGWQTANLTTPIQIIANTTYMACYWSSAGNYVGTPGGFVGSITNPPLTGLADGTDGHNGMYIKNASPAFPNTFTSTNNPPNYWVDVTFVTDAAPTAVIAGANPLTVTAPATSITLDGTPSSDPDGSISSFVWSRISGPGNPTIVTPLGSTTLITGLTPGTHIFQLQVKDNIGVPATTTKTVVVTRSPQSFVIGSGSGAISVPNMGTYISGDTLLIAAGTYTSFTLTDVNNLTIRPETERPIFTTTSTFCNWRYIDMKYINFVSAGSPIAIDATCGRIDSSSATNLYFEGWSNTCWNASGGIYTYIYGVDSTYKWLVFTLDSINLYNSGKFVQGSNNYRPLTNVDIMAKVTINRLIEIASSSVVNEGIGFVGTCYGCVATNIQSTGTTYRIASGTTGWIMGTGWWDVHNFYKWGGPGYVILIYPMTEYRNVGQNKFYNAGKFNGTQFGMASYQFFAVDTIANQRTGCNANMWNNTMGNQFNDNTGYWSSMFNLGPVASGHNYVVRNNFGFAIGYNNNNNNHAPLINNLGGWTPGTDTSRNQYYGSATVAKLDSTTVGFTNILGNFVYYKTTGISPSPLFNTGLTNPYTAIDYFGFAMRVPPDLGYYQFYGVIPPPPVNDGYQWIRTRRPINFLTN